MSHFIHGKLKNNFMKLPIH